MNGDYKELIEFLGEKFAKIDQRFDLIDQRFFSVDNDFKAVNDNFKAINTRFDQIDQRFFSIDEQILSVRETLENKADKMDIVNLQTSVDAYAKKADTYFQEMVMLSHKVERLEKWLNQVAEKVGIKLEY